MKKVLVCLLSVLLAVSLFAACGNKNGTEVPAENGTAEPLSVKTIGEALALGEESAHVAASYDNAYVYVFENNGAYWRVTAELTPEQSEALSALDFFDEDYDEKEKALISPLAVTNCENLTDKMLSADEMAALAGKTGADLLDGGWTTGMGYNLDTMEFFWAYGPFEYTVTFEKTEQLENTDDFDEEAAVAALKVVSVAFSGLSDSSTDLPEE